MEDPGEFYFQKVSVLLHYIIIHTIMYLTHTLQYMLRYLFVLRCSAKFRCEFLCLRRACYVVYEVTNVYNDMGMTGVTENSDL